MSAEQSLSSGLHLFQSEQENEIQIHSKLKAIKETVKEYLNECLVLNLDLTGKMLLYKTLDELCAGDLLALLKEDNASRDLTFEEVRENLPEYLLHAVNLADFPEFIPIYFTCEELALIAKQLKINKYNQNTIDYLRLLLTDQKKAQILYKLDDFITQVPLHQLAKYAYAVKISLGTSYPWEKHPFIKRLFTNSYLEYLIRMD